MKVRHLIVGMIASPVSSMIAKGLGISEKQFLKDIEHDELFKEKTLSEYLDENQEYLKLIGEKKMTEIRKMIKCEVTISDADTPALYSICLCCDKFLKGLISEGSIDSNTTGLSQEQYTDMKRLLDNLLMGLKGISTTHPA